MEKCRKTYKYCIVPMCKNNTNTAPEKIYFVVPRYADIRQEWCKAMRRDNVSSASTLYCCEDHFNIEKDTVNYMQYKIMTLEQGRKVVLLLKKGIVPYIFECQKKNTSGPLLEIRRFQTKRRKALIGECQVEDALTETEVSKVGPSLTSISEAGCSMVSITEAGRSMASIFKEIPSFPVLSKNTSTSPLKLGKISVKRNLLPDHPTGEGTCVNSQSSLSTDFKQEHSSSDTSWFIKDESDSDFKCQSLMCSDTLFAIEKEPEMILGL